MDNRTRIKRRRRRAGDSSTAGEINRQIDRVFHPYFRRGVGAIIADTAAHVIVERDPPKSLEKFFEYNLGPLVREILKTIRAAEKKTGRRGER